MLFGKFLQLDKLSLNEAIGFQEEVYLLWCGFQTGGTHAVARQNLSLRLGLGQVLHARFQSATAEGAERHDFLAAQIDLVQESDDRRGVGAEPNRIAEEYHIVFGDIDFKWLDLRENAFVKFLLAALDGGLEIAIVRLHGDNLIQVCTEFVGDFGGHGFGVASLRIVKHQHLRRFFLGRSFLLFLWAA